MAMARPIVILGPTAAGKSELAVALAEELGSARAMTHGQAQLAHATRPRTVPDTFFGGAEIISADSMQVYRGMDAGTAKPPEALRRRVPHHLIDVVEPNERFTVADWLERTEKLLAELAGRGTRAIIVGGTNLYVQALLEGLFDGPAQDERLRAELAQLENERLHQRLAAVDPAAAARIHRNDRKKMIRAIEVFELTGRTISAWQQQWGSRTSGTPATAPYRHHPILIGLEWPTEQINQRINLRVKAMFFPDQVPAEVAAAVCPKGENLVQETRRLQAAGALGPQAREALGYKQVLQYLRGELTLQQAFEKTKILTRRFAKTQRTWLKRFRGVQWLAADGKTARELAREAMRVVGSPC